MTPLRVVYLDGGADTAFRVVKANGVNSLIVELPVLVSAVLLNGWR